MICCTYRFANIFRFCLRMLVFEMMDFLFFSNHVLLKLLENKGFILQVCPESISKCVEIHRSRHAKSTTVILYCKNQYEINVFTRDHVDSQLFLVFGTLNILFRVFL